MLSNRGKSKINKQNVDAQFIVLADVYHEDVGHFYYNDSDEDIDYIDIKWERNPTMTVVRPEVTSTGVGNGSLSLSTVDQEWIARVRNLNAVPGKERFRCRLIGLMKYDGITELLYDEEYVLNEASWNDSTLQFNMIYDDNWGINIPVVTCNSLIAYGVA